MLQYTRWVPGEKLDSEKLNVPLDYGVFDITGAGIARVSRRSRNSVSVYVPEPFTPRGSGGLPKGEFQWQIFMDVTANQTGFDDARASAILEDG